jgi:HD domain
MAPTRAMPPLDRTLQPFHLVDGEGGRVALTALLESGPVVLAALDEGPSPDPRAPMLRDVAQGAGELGARLVVISPGDCPAGRDLQGEQLATWLTDAGAAFTVLDLVEHRRLGRTRRRSGVFVIDHDGVLRFAFASDTAEEWIPASVVLSRLRRLAARASAPSAPAPASPAAPGAADLDERPAVEVRMDELVREVGRRLGLEAEPLRSLGTACRFRDLGMTTVPNAIVAKDGPLTADEWEVVRQHPERSAQMLGSGPSLDDVRAIVRASHEHLDGSGYPHGLAGDAIPLGSRILLAAESYLAMSQERPYREVLGIGDPLSELEAYAGRLYDPAVVDAIAAVVGATHPAAA